MLAAFAAAMVSPRKSRFVRQLPGIADGHGTQSDWEELHAHLVLFERLLTARPYLMGDRITAADFLAFPFLKYAAAIDPADDERFHQVLHEGQPLDGRPALTAWIRRIDALPRA